MNQKRLLVLVLLLAAVAAFFVFDLKQYVTQEFFESQRARIDAFYAAHPLQTVGRLLRRLRGDHRAVAARRRADDARRRRPVRLLARHAAGVVRLDDRRDARLPGRAPGAARLGAGAVRRTPVRGERRHREGRRLLPVRAAARSALPVLPDQPADGTHADRHAPVLLGQPGGHAARHDGVRVRRHATRAVPRCSAGLLVRLRADRPAAARGQAGRSMR